jgi:hypothetical protein
MAGRKSLPHTLADHLLVMWQPFVPGFYFPGGSVSQYESCSHFFVKRILLALW